MPVLLAGIYHYKGSWCYFIYHYILFKYYRFFDMLTWFISHNMCNFLFLIFVTTGIFSIGCTHLLCSMTSLKSLLLQKYSANQWMTYYCRWKQWILTKSSISLFHRPQIFCRSSVQRGDWFFLGLWRSQRVKVGSLRMVMKCEYPAFWDSCLWLHNKILPCRNFTW